jgi:hypothetical protein
VKLTFEPGSPEATCRLHTEDLIVELVTVEPTWTHPAPGPAHVFAVAEVNTNTIVSPTPADAGTVTDFDVDEPAAECAAATNEIGLVVDTVTDTLWVTELVPPSLSVTVSFTV